ncbi:MAG: superoxide dismutase [Cu-Zn] SodC2 [Nitrospiraceae bacterium]|nr:MAG: superoxide dismutase [Cu-Zn] SodC2 [Nitrospiraceae bacterium]
MKKPVLIVLIASALLLVSAYSFAGEVIVKMFLLAGEGTGKETGTVTATDTQYGLLLVPMLSGLIPGLHGFHVHQNPDCGPAIKEGKPVAGLAAGGHYDPAGSGKHEGPYGNGHTGDLPALHVDSYGKAALPVLAPRLKVLDLTGRSLMVHSGGDNYSDMPEKLGGGGARAACGVIK